MKYRDNMSDEDRAILMAEIESLDYAYATVQDALIGEEDLEDWTEKERRAMRP